MKDVSESEDKFETYKPILFLPKTYLSAFGPIRRGSRSFKEYLYEGQASMYYFVWNSLGSEKLRTDGGYGLAIPIVMQLQVRQNTSFSNPVDTPSYKPGLRFQFFKLVRNGISSKTYWMGSFQTGIQHYSNGQKGCFFEGHEVLTRSDGSKACVAGPAVLANNSALNTDNGSFSLNYIPLEWWARWGTINPVLNGLADSSITIGAQIKYLFAMDPAQEELYGTHQYKLTLEWENLTLPKNPAHNWSKMMILRAAATYEWAWGRGRYRGDEFQLEASLIPMSWSGTGFFVRYHWGRDNYNINFLDQRPYFQFGIMIDPQRLYKFKLRSQDE